MKQSGEKRFDGARKVKMAKFVKERRIADEQRGEVKEDLRRMRER